MFYGSSVSLEAAKNFHLYPASTILKIGCSVGYLLSRQFIYDHCIFCAAYPIHMYINFLLINVYIFVVRIQATLFFCLLETRLFLSC